MSNIVFRVGDLVQSNTGGINGKEWFGIILEDGEMQPKVYPIYARKYKIKWCRGTTAWHWGADIKLVCEAKE